MSTTTVSGPVPRPPAPFWVVVLATLAGLGLVATGLVLMVLWGLHPPTTCTQVVEYPIPLWHSAQGANPTVSSTCAPVNAMTSYPVIFVVSGAALLLPALVRLMPLGSEGNVGPAGFKAPPVPTIERIEATNAAAQAALDLAPVVKLLTEQVDALRTTVSELPVASTQMQFVRRKLGLGTTRR